MLTSSSAISTYEPRVRAVTDLLLSKIRDRGADSLDITAWAMYYTFDIMGEVGFSKDFDNVASGTENPAIKAIHDHMAVLGVLSNVPWLLNMIGCIPGAAAGYTSFFNWCSNEIKEKQKVENETPISSLRCADCLAGLGPR